MTVYAIRGLSAGSAYLVLVVALHVFLNAVEAGVRVAPWAAEPQGRAYTPAVPRPPPQQQLHPGPLAPVVPCSEISDEDRKMLYNYVFDDRLAETCPVVLRGSGGNGRDSDLRAGLPQTEVAAFEDMALAPY